MIDALIDGAGLQPLDIAFFTQRDSYGDAGFSGGIAALQRHGLQDANQVLHVRYERNTLAVENALATLLYARREPRAIIMVGAYGPCAKFIKLAHEAGLRALFLNVSFVGSNPLATELGHLPVPVIVTQVVPHPARRAKCRSCGNTRRICRRSIPRLSRILARWKVISLPGCWSPPWREFRANQRANP